MGCVCFQPYDIRAKRLPPWVILRAQSGERIAKTLPAVEGLQVRFNPNAYWEEGLQKEWLRWLDIQVCTSQPRLLVMDAFSAHLTDDSLALAKQLGFFMVIIPGGLTSLLQPLDVVLNSCFKRKAKELYVQWLSGGSGPLTPSGCLKRIGHADLIRLIAAAWREGFSSL